MINDNGKVIGVEHIKEIHDRSIECIKKNHKNLLENESIVLVCDDGRKGYKKYAPYKVIHVGAAAEVIPNELVEQLDFGGRMFIPAGKIGEQAIYLVNKDLNGNTTYLKTIGVRYGLLTSIENQLKIKK
jgi:protein-L-isoaspartate(D-aspartate) O-methyltransferase